MSITTERLPVSKNIKLIYKQRKYPQSELTCLPRNYYLGVFCGARNMGKTHKLCQMLKLFETHKMVLDGVQVSQRIILISPTYHSNPVWTSLKYLDEEDVHHEYSDEVLKGILADIKHEKQETADYREKMIIYKKFVRSKSVDHLTQHEIFQLEMMGYELPEKCKYPNGVVNTLIIDDCAGSSIYKSHGPSLFTRTAILNRHIDLNIILCQQSMKATPRIIRQNVSLWVLYRVSSTKLLCSDLYDEVSGYISLENFEKLFEFATSGEYGALVIDTSQPKEYIFKKNFDTVLHIT